MHARCRAVWRALAARLFYLQGVDKASAIVLELMTRRPAPIRSSLLLIFLHCAEISV
ncbi:MAG: hypothetical protein QME21_04990 [Anaerolineales bacterium]|nr:hypothetical protein [Anaerolineales bacterium]